MPCADTETQTSGKQPFNAARPARPLLWWRGGKRNLMAVLRRARPLCFGRYIDPFAGGLAPFLDIMRIGSAGPRAFLGDANGELMRTYKAVAESPERVLAATERRLEHHSICTFEAARFERWEALDEIETAARMLYLNRTSYNALYRVDRRDRFCVGMGHDKSGDLRHRIDPGNLRAVSQLLRTAELHCGDFSAVVAVAKAGDYCQLDPPYPNTCCDYTPLGFTNADQRRVRDVCSELDRVGAMWLQTNADCDLVRGLYADYQITPVSTYRRAGNSCGASAARELIIVNGALEIHRRWNLAMGEEN